MRGWIVTILSGMLCAVAVTGAVAQGLSNRGIDFWTGYGLHQFMEDDKDNSQDMVLYFSADNVPANVTVTTRGRTATEVKTYYVPANTVIVSDRMPKNKGPKDVRLIDDPPSFGGNGGDGLFHVSIHIESDVPVVAYAHIYGSNSSGATMLMPVETWGYSYISLNAKQEFASNCFSFAYVVAQHDKTLVEITPSVPTRDGHEAGKTFTAELNKGDIYQVVGANINDGLTGYELTGTTVKSVANDVGECYPVGFFSGSSRTRNPCSLGGGGGDNDMQQSFPYEAWGKRYFTAPTSSSHSATAFMQNMYKVVVTDPATVVKRNGVALGGYDAASKSYYFESNVGDYIEADKPILLAQFMSGGPCAGGGPLGDPEMIYLSPVEQGIKRTGFYRNTEEYIVVNYLTLIIHKNGVASLTIDDKNDFSHTYPHPQNPDYTVVIKRWTSAKKQCVVKSDSAFTAVTYGLGETESYGYNAGTLVNNLNAVLQVRNVADTAHAHAYTCKNTPVALSVLMAYMPNRLEWQLSQQPGISPAADVVQANPVAAGIEMYRGITYYRYELPGTYTFANAGLFNVPIRSSHPKVENCYRTERIITSVEVKEAPKASFSIQHTGCMADSVHFTADKSGSSSFTNVRWKWTFDDGFTADTATVGRLYTAAGDYKVGLHSVSFEGCVADSVASFTIGDRPVVDIVINDAEICAGETVDVSAVNAPGSTATVKSWYWNLGNGTTAATAHPDAVKYLYGTYTIQLVGKITEACKSDTVTKVVTVHALPAISFSYPKGCLPEAGSVVFSNGTTSADGQAITGHAWNFGDAAATPGNLNTSTMESPSHDYTKYGAYTITYEAVTINGCKADTAIVANFNLKPKLTFANPPAVCENAAAVSVALAVVTNGAAGTGVYKGTGVDAAGHFTPSIAGAGTHTLKYVFTTEAGCIDSASAAIVVWPVPQAVFTIPADVCANAALSITEASVVNSGNITGGSWVFGDGSGAAYTGADVSKIYSAAGEYMIRLTVTTDKGCADDTASAIQVKPVPAVAFDVPAAICMPGGSATFVNHTAIAGNTALTYTWYFSDDGSTVTAANAAHTYAVAGTYEVGLKAVSLYGCADSIGKKVSAFYNRPVAAFDVLPATVCQGETVRFTDAGAAAGNSPVVSWRWLFSDGTAATGREPVKVFGEVQTYTAQLLVTNAAGCVSDTLKKTIRVYLQPVVDAGAPILVPEGSLVRFNPTVNDSTHVTFSWAPAALLGDATALRPVYLANADMDFTLTATGKEGGCTASDLLSVKVFRQVIVPNAFTPNGDGVHDTWDITNLSAYPGCTVVVFNRYGQQVYYATGYSTPWKGNNDKGALPAGTYYYIIDLKNGAGKLTGSVTILK